MVLVCKVGMITLCQSDRRIKVKELHQPVAFSKYSIHGGGKYKPYMEVKRKEDEEFVMGAQVTSSLSVCSSRVQYCDGRREFLERQ